MGFKRWGFVWLSVLCLLAGCSGQSNVVKEVAVDASPAVSISQGDNSETPKETIAQPAEQTNKQKLFEEGIQTFDGAKSITLLWEGHEAKASFSKSSYEPFGLYIPAAEMEEYSFEDGNEWGYDDGRNHITLLPYDKQYLSDVSMRNEELVKYEEYAGSFLDTKYTDYFVLQKDDLKYIVYFTYFEKEQAKALPMFLKVLKSLKYVDNK